jgi:hypothetical protein
MERKEYRVIEARENGQDGEGHKMLLSSQVRGGQKNVY